jgi:hypothetical protein
MKITLALCTNRLVQPQTVQCLLEMVAYSKDTDFHVLVASRGYTVAENRNYCVVQAQRNGSDYLFFIDDDMTFPEDTLELLLGHKKDVIGVNSYSRCLPLSSTVGLMDKDGNYMHPDTHTAWETRVPQELFKAYFVGAGVMLIDMKVFDRIDKPYFEFIAGEEGMILHGEDGSFCDKVKKANIDIWCDGTLEVGHLGLYEYKRDGGEITSAADLIQPL